MYDVVITTIDKKQGTVQFVGKVHWTKGLWVGVAFDEAVGKHDGVDHKKRYFKCKPKHGVMQKSSYWKKVTEFSCCIFVYVLYIYTIPNSLSNNTHTKININEIHSKKGGKKGKKGDVSVSTGKDKKGKKGKKSKKDAGGGGGDEPERTPEPKKAPVVTVDAQIQTDPPEEEIS